MTSLLDVLPDISRFINIAVATMVCAIYLSEWHSVGWRGKLTISVLTILFSSYAVAWVIGYLWPGTSDMFTNLLFRPTFPLHILLAAYLFQIVAPYRKWVKYGQSPKR